MNKGLFQPGLRQAGDPGGAAAVTAALITDATAAGRALLTAVDAAAQALLLPVATDLLAGLMSAADKAALATMPRRIADSLFAAQTTLTFPFTANQYRRLVLSIDWDAGGFNDIALTGLAAGSYNSLNQYDIAGSSANTNVAGGNSWQIYSSGGAVCRGAGTISINLGPAPRKKAFLFEVADNFVGYPIARKVIGWSDDVVNDPTGLVVNFDAPRSGGYSLWGWP